jgi:HPt (histidine-containing phosphotransfer) domain-containing protein
LSQKANKRRKVARASSGLLGEYGVRLRERFIERTAVDVESIQRLLERACENSEALSEVARIAHTIHGAGASFGLARVGDCAARIEVLVKQRRQQPDPPQAPVNVIADISRLVMHLDEALRAARSAH